MIFCFPVCLSFNVAPTPLLFVFTEQKRQSKRCYPGLSSCLCVCVSVCVRMRVYLYVHVRERERVHLRHLWVCIRERVRDSLTSAL